MKPHIREAQAADTPELARLCTELGYPSTPPEISARLGFVLAASDHLLLVAADAAADRPVAWLHAVLRRSLLTEPFVDVAGLVVAEGRRGEGTGAALLAAAEGWARGRGVGTVRIRSNVTRERAHRFYLRAGYALTKTSYVFSKTLPRP